jgi:hypothetical protein
MLPKPRTPGRALVLSVMLASSATGCFDPYEMAPDLVASTSGNFAASGSGDSSITGVISTTSTTTTTGVVDPGSTSVGSSAGTTEAGSSSSSGCPNSECGSCVDQLCDYDTGDYCGTCQVIGWPALGAGLYQPVMSDVMFGHPLELLEGGRLLDLSITVSDPSQGSRARLLVYAIVEDGTPVLTMHTEPLLLQNGTNAAGFDDFVQGPEIHLEPGWYWLMVHFDAVTSLFRSIDGSDYEQVFESLDFDTPVPAELPDVGSLSGHRYFISGTLQLDKP